MRIICKPANVVDCPRCKCVLEFSKDDIQINPSGFRKGTSLRPSVSNLPLTAAKR